MNITGKVILGFLAMPFIALHVFWKEFQAGRKNVCPSCGGRNFTTRHHHANFLAPECDYKHCEDCGHEWDRR